MKFSFQKILFLVFVLSFGACKKDKSPESKIAGAWLVTQLCEIDNSGQITDCTQDLYNPCLGEPSDGFYFFFNSDGTYRRNFPSCTGAGEYTCTNYDEGTWDATDALLNVDLSRSFDCSSAEFEPDTESGSLIIVSLSEDEFVVTDEEDPSDIIQLTFTRQ